MPLTIDGWTLFHVDDGETHWILARDFDEARVCEEWADDEPRIRPATEHEFTWGTIGDHDEPGKRHSLREVAEEHARLLAMHPHSTRIVASSVGP